jgi:hypothetical protein
MEVFDSQYLNKNEGEIPNNELKSSKYFNTNKEKTNDFFKQTRVDSCSHVFVKNGQSVAVPFKITNQKGLPLNHFKYNQDKSSETISIYRKDYCIRPFMHVGMERKPLMRYDPDSYRSRLPTSGIIMSHKNKSIIEIGDRG